MIPALTQEQIVEIIRDALGDATPALDVTEAGEVSFRLRGACYRICACVRMEVETPDGRKLAGDFYFGDGATLQGQLVVLIRKTAERLAREAA